MNRTEHLLSCLAEECAEVAQRATKAQRFGMDEIQPGQDLSNRERLSQELSDLVAVVDMLGFAIHVIYNEDALDAKKRKVENCMRYAEGQGALQP